METLTWLEVPMTADSHVCPSEQFQARCLDPLERVQKDHTPVIITKDGMPVARLIPCDDKAVPLFGFMAGTMAIEGDIVASLDENWESEF